MGLLVTIGLSFQTAALVLLFRRLKGRWFTYTGAVLIVLATGYHGFNEILLWLFPDQDRYRLLVSPNYVGQFTLLISVAILFLTLTYLYVLGRRRVASASNQDENWNWARLRQVFDWRPWLLAAGVMFVPTLAGIGYSTGAVAGVQRLDTGLGLVSQFLLLAIPLASFAIILRFGRHWFLPALVAQSVAIALVGQRLGIVVAGAVLVYALVRVGVSIGRSQLMLAGVGFLVVAIVITSARAAEGRLSTTAGGSLRIDYLFAGIKNLGAPTIWSGLSADFGYRLDGNSFGAMELEALDGGMPILGFRPLLNDVRLAIPSFLNPGKTFLPIEDRSEKEYAEIYLGLPLPLIAPGTHQDILTTQLGAIIGFAGPWGLLFISVLLGALFALVDRWLLNRITPSRLLIGLGLLSCVVSYEGSWDVYPVTFRGIVLLLPIVWLLQRRWTHHEAPQVGTQQSSLSAAV